MVNHCCSEMTFKLHIQPLHGKNTSSERTASEDEWKRASYAAVLPGDGMSGLWEAAAELSILLSLEVREPGRYLPGCTLPVDFQLPLLLHVAACASGIWERNIPPIKTSGGLHILLWPLPFFLFPDFFLLFLPNLGDEKTLLCS